MFYTWDANHNEIYYTYYILTNSKMYEHRHQNDKSIILLCQILYFYRLYSIEPDKQSSLNLEFLEKTKFMSIIQKKKNNVFIYY